MTVIAGTSTKSPGSRPLTATAAIENGRMLPRCRPERPVDQRTSTASVMGANRAPHFHDFRRPRARLYRGRYAREARLARGGLLRASNRGKAIRAVVPGAQHYHFNDRGASGAGEPAEGATQDFVAKNGVAFFDAALLGQGSESIGTASSVKAIAVDRK